MSQLEGSVASVTRMAGEALTLRQQGTGSFSVATQTWTPGANVDTATYGSVRLVETGVDGVTTKRGDLEVTIPKLPLDMVSITPAIGDTLLRGSMRLTILEVAMDPIAGAYRCRARVAT